MVRAKKIIKTRQSRARAFNWHGQTNKIGLESVSSCLNHGTHDKSIPHSAIELIIHL